MKKIISAILLASMLASLAACGGDGDGKNPNKTDDSEKQELPAGIEKKDYGEDFAILAPEWGLYNNYFFADDPGTDAMSKALYEREVTVEEHLGVTITPSWVATIYDVLPKLREDNMSGDNLYQLALTHCMNGNAAAISEGLLYDMNTISTINFDADYYNHSANENLSLAGHQYFAVSDFLIPDPNAILFNKGLVEELNLEDPYELVRNGEWTIDKMMEMMNAATLDNGDGRWNMDDTYGFGMPDNWYLCDFLYSSGLLLTQKNDNGEFELAFGKDERVYTMGEKLNALFNGPDTYLYNSVDQNYDNDLSIDKGKSLFGIVSINALNVLRDTEVEYGILPYPKLDENQDSYYALNWSGLMCVPKNAKNTDMIGEVIELLAYYSDDAVIPAYFDIMLGEKLSRDNESKEMLSLIFDNAVFDAGMNYFGYDGNMHQLFYTGGKHIASKPSFSMASHLASYSPGAQAEIEAFNDAFAKIDG